MPAFGNKVKLLGFLDCNSRRILTHGTYYWEYRLIVLLLKYSPLSPPMASVGLFFAHVIGS